jgi:RNA polymerase sigma-70 factor (ECF subfamily)
MKEENINKNTELATKSQQGDVSAFDLLVKNNLQLVYNFTYRLCQDEHIASDVAQEVFIKVWKKLHTYNPEKSFKNWLLQITHHTTIDFLRKKKYFSFSELSNEENDFADTIADEALLADEIFSKNENFFIVRQALDSLSSAEREIILFHLDQELTFAEISKILHKSLNTIKSSYRRSLLKLKEILTDKIAPK